MQSRIHVSNTFFKFLPSLEVMIVDALNFIFASDPLE